MENTASSGLKTADKRKRDADDSPMEIDAKVGRLDVADTFEDMSNEVKRGTAGALAATEAMQDGMADEAIVRSDLLGGATLQRGLPVTRLNFLNNPSLDTIGVISPARQLESTVEFSGTYEALFRFLLVIALLRHARESSVTPCQPLNLSTH